MATRPWVWTRAPFRRNDDEPANDDALPSGGSCARRACVGGAGSPGSPTCPACPTCVQCNNVTCNGTCPACFFNRTANAYYLLNINPSTRKLGFQDQWQPAINKTEFIGTCQYRIDHNCTVVPGPNWPCRSNNSCIDNNEAKVCNWQGDPFVCKTNTCCLFKTPKCGRYDPLPNGTRCGSIGNSHGQCYNRTCFSGNCTKINVTCPPPPPPLFPPPPPAASTPHPPPNP
eukprot:SM002235S07008  [mRNA]  locus=s2235:2:1621:- [translate_table: standard]